jgi:hypothetical protein
MENTIFGGLIEFENINELNEFIDQIEEKSAIQMLEKSLEYCQRQGMFNLMESNVIYKCINKLKQP